MHMYICICICIGPASPRVRQSEQSAIVVRTRSRRTDPSFYLSTFLPIHPSINLYISPSSPYNLTHDTYYLRNDKQ